MERIGWCIKKREGLQLIKPNINLSNAYLKKAEEALESIKLNTIKDWKISTSYYTLYFSIYAILMKIGMKCEIHSCTISFAKAYLTDFFEEKELEFLEASLKARIDSQYYIDRSVSDEQFKKMINYAPEFLIKCKSILTQLNEKKTKEIRNRFISNCNKS